MPMPKPRQRWRLREAKVVMGRKFYIYQYFQGGPIWAIPADALIGETRPWP